MTLLTSRSMGWSLLATLSWSGSWAQGVPVRPGEVVEHVRSVTDAGQSYALFVPRAYSPDRTWPVLFLMDPRGRALVPLERLRPAAEQFGYLILSSYNTASDTEVDPNVDAVNAMIGDVAQTLAGNVRRFYLVGFSGTAREAWSFGYQLGGHVAGVIGFGAGLPPGIQLPDVAPGDSAPFVFFGGAGATDFNYEEVLALDDYLGRKQIPHRMRYYAGGHGWAPDAVMTEAIEWLELQAMRRGLADRRGEWLDSLFERRAATADSLERGGSPYAAWQEFSALAADFGGLRDVAGPLRRAAQLVGSKETRRAIARSRELQAEHVESVRSLAALLNEVRTSKRPLSLPETLDRLNVKEWQRAASDRRDTVAALAAERRLENIFVMTSFYGPREYLASGDGARALALLDVAEAIRPGMPHVCEARAKALRLLGRTREAERLSCRPSQ